ncbi:MAG: hypothetical protein EHM47_16185, partial [Ignavibacteriales bacterium]
MEKLLKKYLNGTCTPDEFKKVIELLCDNRNEDKLTITLENSWKEIMSQNIDRKHNDQLLARIYCQVALKESEIYLKQFTLVRSLLKVAAVLIIGLVLSTVIFYHNSRTRMAQNV